MPTYVRDAGAWKTVSGGSTPAATVPTGAVFHFAASTPPTGYLKANGDTVPNGTGTVQGISANFSDLYAILGSTYGAAGKLPDLRGEFVRGWADDRAVDTGRTFGTEQGDALKDHTHTYDRFQETGTGLRGGPSSVIFSNISTNTGSPSTGSATETRPRNIALLACIKY
jgi:microcystin-dependent protein